MNLLSVLVAAVADRVLGSLWYSMLFGEVWSKGLEAHGIAIKEPMSGQLRAKAIESIVFNLPGRKSRAKEYHYVHNI